MKWKQLQGLVESGLVVVVRRPKASQMPEIAEALIEGGSGAIEITVDTPGVYEMIRQIKMKYGNRILVGAGTVLDAQTAKTAIDAGSDFIFSPIVDEETIHITNQYGRISIPGVMTPTEMVRAYRAGADLLKIFPGRSLGVNYLKELIGPLGHIPMMPTGGVNLDNVAQFIKNGAEAVGVGGALMNKQELEDCRYDLIMNTTKKFVAAIKQARE